MCDTCFQSLKLSHSLVVLDKLLTDVDRNFSQLITQNKGLKTLQEAGLCEWIGTECIPYTVEENVSLLKYQARSHTWGHHS